MKIVQYNPFRYLGLFANATLREQTAMATQMKAYARVGQKVDSPLLLSLFLGELPCDEATIKENEFRLELPKEREQYAFFWFMHGPDPDEDLKAVEMLDKGMFSEAMAVWKKRSDREALQNLMVTALLLEDVKEAIRLAQQIHHDECNIRRFVNTLTDDFQWLTVQILRDYAKDDPQWASVLKDIQLSVCRQNIEKCLENAQCQDDSETYEALYDATSDLDLLRAILGPDNATYQSLADQLANALVLEKFAPLRVQNPLKWFDKAYEIMVLEETKVRVMVAVFSFYENILNDSVESRKKTKQHEKQLLELISYNGPIVELKALIQERVKEQKTVNHWKIGCGALGLLILILLHILLKPVLSHTDTNRPPEITLPPPVQLPDSIPYHEIEVPELPDFSRISSYQIPSLPEKSVGEAALRKMDSMYQHMTDEERQRLLDRLSEEDSKSAEEKTLSEESVTE